MRKNSFYTNERQFIQASTIRHDFYVSGEIEGPEAYTELLQTLHSAQPQDSIHIHINSEGGDFYTACQIADAIQTSRAGEIVTYAEGMVISAATLIFLAADCWVVSPFSTFLFHTSSGLLIGKHPDSLKQAQAHKEHLNRVCSQVYHVFFTEDEIDQILNKNNDMWLTPNEVNERLSRVERFQTELQSEMNAKLETAQKLCADAGVGINISTF